LIPFERKKYHLRSTEEKGFILEEEGVVCGIGMDQGKGQVEHGRKYLLIKEKQQIIM
jgi:hypothetical protein